MKLISTNLYVFAAIILVSQLLFVSQRASETKAVQYFAQNLSIFTTLHPR